MILGMVLSGVLSGLANGGTYPGPNQLQTFDYADGTVDLGDGSRANAQRESGVGGIGEVRGGTLWLSERSTLNAVGSYRLPNLDPANVIKSFDISFGIVMDLGSATVAGEGWSLNFGRIPDDNGTGEGGFAPLRGGLTIALDTREGGGELTSIEVLVGGVRVAVFPRTFSFGATSRAVSAHWDQGGLDLSFDGRVICADLNLPGFSPGVGDVFAWSSRTTDSGMDTRLDNLRVTTQALPVIEAGGPIISEFVVNNADFEDEFADKPGWIELMNASGSTVDLAGWYLTDSKENLTRWKIPGLVLSPYNYQIIFASGRDRQSSSTSFNHAGFVMARGGGYLALVRPDGKTVASQYEYGPQDKGVAFGEQGSGRKRGFMFPPSPGAVNTVEAAVASFAPEVGFSHAGGFVSDLLTVHLQVPEMQGLVVRYTLDRAEPGPNAPVYQGPIEITRTTTVRARAYAPGHLAGRVTSRTFVMMDASLSNFVGSGRVFESNIPLVFVDSFGVDVDGSSGGSRPFRPSQIMVIPTDSTSGRARFGQAFDYAGPAGVHVRGESSAGFEQKSYALEIWDETNRDRDVSLLGMPADSDWVLYGPWSEKTFMRNKLVFDWMRTLRGNDGTAPRTQFIELFFNQTRSATGKVGYASYRGIYLLMEKLKRGKDRVPIEGLNDKTVDPQLITGGYIFRKDKDDTLKNNWTTPRYGIPLQSFDPDRLNLVQLTYLRNYVSAFETALAGGNYRDPKVGYRAFIDPDTFIDAQWFLEIAKQVDGYVFSTYFHKDRAGRLRAGPLWDFNISLGNADYASGDRATGWLYDTAGGVGSLWYPRLHADPDYKMAHWDRYWEMRRTFLSDGAVLGTIDAHMVTLLDGYAGSVSNRAPSTLQNPVARHFRRWPRLGTRDWPNPPAETRITTWQGEVGYMKDWLRTRLDWLDDQSARVGSVVYRPPTLSHSGGAFSNAFSLTLTPFSRVTPSVTYPDGEIYYTTDRSDPRLPGGSLSAAARLYQGPIRIDRSTTVRARLYAQSRWSPIVTATYLKDPLRAGSSRLVITEILYRPSPLTTEEMAAGLTDATQFEFLELRNTSTQPIDLAPLRFVEGIDFEFGAGGSGLRWLGPGDSGVFVADARAFALRYPQVPSARVLGTFRGRLDNAGETLGLTFQDGLESFEFRYDNGTSWPSTGISGGLSLVLREPVEGRNLNLASSWTSSARLGGTPGISGVGSDTFQGEPHQDSDRDGVDDLMEFVNGSDLLNPGSNFPVRPVVVVEEKNGVKGQYLSFEFRRATGLKGVAVVVEGSRDLRNWEAATNRFARVATRANPDGSETDLYRTAEPILGSGTGDSLYFRIAVNIR